MFLNSLVLGIIYHYDLTKGTEEPKVFREVTVKGFNPADYQTVQVIKRLVVHLHRGIWNLCFWFLVFKASVVLFLINLSHGQRYVICLDVRRQLTAYPDLPFNITWISQSLESCHFWGTQRDDGYNDTCQLSSSHRANRSMNKCYKNDFCYCSLSWKVFESQLQSLQWTQEYFSIVGYSRVKQN